MQKSESLKELATALVKAQLELKNPGYDRSNPHFKSKFASLAAVRDTVIPTLAKNGIAVVQSLRATEGGIACETMLMHTSGEWLTDTLELPVSKHDAQGCGSAATYARRYSLMSFAGVVGDEDDDGNAAVKTTAEAMVRANIRPAGGVLESLPAESHTQVRLVASLVLDAWNAENPKLTVENWQKNASQLSQDERVAAWDLLPSIVRSHIDSVLRPNKNGVKRNSGVGANGVIQA